jgi:hypothetical protein
LLIVAIMAFVLGGGCPSVAQTSGSQPTSSGVAQQFKSGADRVGEGATQIGEGIKQGAIMTWEAIKAGASAASAKFSGSSSATSKTAGSSAQQSH